MDYRDGQHGGGYGADPLFMQKSPYNDLMKPGRLSRDPGERLYQTKNGPPPPADRGAGRAPQDRVMPFGYEMTQAGEPATNDRTRAWNGLEDDRAESPLAPARPAEKKGNIFTRHFKKVLGSKEKQQQQQQQHAGGKRKANKNISVFKDNADNEPMEEPNNFVAPDRRKKVPPPRPPAPGPTAQPAAQRHRPFGGMADLPQRNVGLPSFASPMSLGGFASRPNAAGAADDQQRSQARPHTSGGIEDLIQDELRRTEGKTTTDATIQLNYSHVDPIYARPYKKKQQQGGQAPIGNRPPNAQPPSHHSSNPVDRRRAQYGERKAKPHTPQDNAVKPMTDTTRHKIMIAEKAMKVWQAWGGEGTVPRDKGKDAPKVSARDAVEEPLQYDLPGSAGYSWQQHDDPSNGTELSSNIEEKTKETLDFFQSAIEGLDPAPPNNDPDRLSGDKDSDTGEMRRSSVDVSRPQPRNLMSPRNPDPYENMSADQVATGSSEYVDGSKYKSYDKHIPGPDDHRPEHYNAHNTNMGATRVPTGGFKVSPQMRGRGASPSETRKSVDSHYNTLESQESGYQSHTPHSRNKDEQLLNRRQQLNDAGGKKKEVLNQREERMRTSSYNEQHGGWMPGDDLSDDSEDPDDMYKRLSVTSRNIQYQDIYQNNNRVVVDRIHRDTDGGKPIQKKDSLRKRIMGSLSRSSKKRPDVQQLEREGWKVVPTKKYDYMPRGPVKISHVERDPVYAYHPHQGLVLMPHAERVLVTQDGRRILEKQVIAGHNEPDLSAAARRGSDPARMNYRAPPAYARRRDYRRSRSDDPDPGYDEDYGSREGRDRQSHLPVPPRQNQDHALNRRQNANANQRVSGYSVPDLETIYSGESDVLSQLEDIDPSLRRGTSDPDISLANDRPFQSQPDMSASYNKYTDNYRL